MNGFRTSGPSIAIAAMLGLLGAHRLGAQDSPDMPATMARVQAVARERRPEMETAARAFIYNIAQIHVGGGEGAIGVPVLDQLKAANLDAYWMEIGQLAVQFDMFQRVAGRDTLRAHSMAAMFATEFHARMLQRAWRGASEADRRTMRGQLETLMTRHFEAEDELRALEVQDIERRLTEARGRIGTAPATARGAGAVVGGRHHPRGPRGPTETVDDRR